MGSTGLHQLSEQKGMVGIGYNVYSEQVYITGDRHQTKQEIVPLRRAISLKVNYEKVKFSNCAFCDNFNDYEWTNM